MKITTISVQAKNKDRVNVSVDGKYRFSLDIFQLVDLGIKVGNEYSEQELVDLEQESQFGKLYGRALEYSLMRPHSAKEIRDYLWRKTRTTKVKNRHTGEISDRVGVSQSVADRVFDRLLEKGYIDDEKFTRYWVDNRSLTRGASRRKLEQELMAKGVDRSIVEAAFAGTERSDSEELQKVIVKKRSRYPDEQKFIAYLMRQGFRYDDIREQL
jgi:regulatory protein